MRIRLAVGEASATARLYDNDTARDFASLLPVTITVHDLGAREKAGALPRALTGGVGRASTEPVSSATGRPARTWPSTTTRTASGFRPPGS